MAKKTGKWWSKEADEQAQETIKNLVGATVMEVLAGGHQATIMLLGLPLSQRGAAGLYWLEVYTRHVAEIFDLPVPGYAK